MASFYYRQSDCGAGGRSGVYGDQGYRDDKKLKWIYRKIAWVEAGSLTIPMGGGLETGGNYIKGGTDGKHIPRSTITSVTISSEGDLGSVLKCTLNFTVYGLSELNAKQSFFKLGSDITVTYGWEDLGSGYGSSGYFTGTIYNFTYSTRQGGGFDCTTYAMGKNMNALTGKAKAASDSDGSFKDPLDNEVPSNDLKALIQKLAADAKAASLTTNTINGDEIGMVEISQTKEPAEDIPNATATKGEAEKFYFISLKKIVQLIVSKVLATGGPKMQQFKIKCDNTVTIGPVPGNSSILVSANPLEVIFPGYGTYGASLYDFAGSSQAGSFAGGDLSACMISVTWLTEMFTNLGMMSNDRERSADQSIGQFLKNIFDMIYQNSGNRFQLTCVEDIDDPSHTTLAIVDVNQVDPSVTPVTLEAVTAGSVCRSLSLTAKVPDLMQAAAYVGNKSTLAGDVAFPSAGGSAPTYASAQADLDAAKTALDVAGVNEDVVMQLRSALQGIFVFNTDGKSNHAPLFPLSLSATIDGIEGFKFGDAVTTNYLPSQYTGKVAFAVTRVTHQIGGGDWTTTVDTVCRLLP